MVGRGGEGGGREGERRPSLLYDYVLHLILTLLSVPVRARVLVYTTRSNDALKASAVI